MTDRGVSALRQTRDSFTVGPSSLQWDGTRLTIDVNEVSSPPLISRVRGTITLTPTAITDVELPLTPEGTHVWRPFAPTAAIKVDLEAKGWQWEGHGYFDANFGTRALEQDFTYWTWARCPQDDGSLAIYDATRMDGSTLATGIRFEPSGTAAQVPLPPQTPMARTAWLLRREGRADPGTTPRQVKPMLDAPFYCRSVVETRIDGKPLTGVHEALDLTRFRSPLLKPMLAVRVPRRRNWSF